MVIAEIRTPVYDEESCTVTWVARATVRADGLDLVITPEGELIDRDLAVIDMVSGRSLRGEDDPETWARNLPYSYRAGDIDAVIVHDTDPVALDGTDDDNEPLPEIPDPTSKQDRGQVGGRC